MRSFSNTGRCRLPAVRLLGAAAVAFAAPALADCASRDADAALRQALPPVTLTLERVGSLQTEPGPLLASANSLARGRDGRVLVGDGSDRQIKVFSSGGAQIQPIGRPGAGPGEFATLLSAGMLGDSAFGWDVRANRLTVFDPAGRYARAVALQQPGSPRFGNIRVMDDSLLVASGWVMGAHDRPLVEVFDRTGRPVGQMANFKRVFSPPDPKLLPHVWVFADGSDGVVFSTLHGFDTIQAHSPDGRLLGAGHLGLRGHQPVLDLRRLLAQNHGDLMRPDSTWAQDGHFAALKLVALGGGLAAVQFGKLELTQGTDLLASGGPIVILRLEPGGVIVPVGQIESPGALLSRDRPGQALILRWSGEQLDHVELFRLTTHTQARR